MKYRDDQFWDAMQQLAVVVAGCLLLGWFVSRIAPLPRRVVASEPVVVIHKTVPRPIILPQVFPQRFMIDPPGATLADGFADDLVWRPLPRKPPAEDAYLLPWPSLSTIEVKGVPQHATRHSRDRRANIQRTTAPATDPGSKRFRDAFASRS